MEAEYVKKFHWLAAGTALVTIVAVVAVVAALGILVPGSGGAPADALASAGQAQLALPQDELSPNAREDDPDGSIMVHGLWTIDVLDPDGTTVSSHSFTNAYTGGGNLPRLLARDRVVGTWIVEISGESLCNNDAGARVNCQIHESKTPFSGAHIFPNLSASVGTSGANQNRLVLTGFATSQHDGQVTSVATQIRTCAGNVSPESCTGAAGVMAFTSRSIPAADRPSVVAGQQVAVTVVIGFN
jgi:hypothetical protein